MREVGPLVDLGLVRNESRRTVHLEVELLYLLLFLIRQVFLVQDLLQLATSYLREGVPTPEDARSRLVVFIQVLSEDAAQLVAKDNEVIDVLI